MARMGPAFDRSKFGFLLVLAGLTISLFPPHGLIASETIASEDLITAIYWMVPGTIGLYMAASGAPIYFITNPTRLIIGWLLILSSGAMMLSSWAPDLGKATSAIATLMGVVMALLIHVIAIRVTESLPSRDGVTLPLEEHEVKHISSILSSHIDQKEVTSDE